MPIRVHVTKNGKRYWQLYYEDPVTEERHWRSARTTDRRTAERAAARWEADLAAGVTPHLDRLTWSAFRERFEAEHLSGLADKTARAYRTALNALEREIHPARLATVSAAVLSQFASALRPALSETSIDTYLTHLSSALHWAVEVGLLAKAPQRPRIRVQKTMRSRPATGEELDRMLAVVPAVCPQDAAGWQRYLRGLHLSGLRLAESLRLSWDQDEFFAVEYDGEWHYRIYSEGQKSRRDQQLPITPDFAELLETTPAADRRGQVFRLHGSSGREIHGVNTVARVLTAIATRANCSCTAHDFRRAFGTRWALRVLPTVLQKLMRHRSIQTTMRYYVHLDTADVSAAIRDWRVNPQVNPAPVSVTSNSRG